MTKIFQIYENEIKEKLINARELFYELRGDETKTKFADWIKERLIKYKFVENRDFICFRNFTKANRYGNKTTKEYYITIDTAKELCMIENNETGRKIRMYFIETEKRYRQIINNPSNIFDFMRLALNEIERNSNEISKVKSIALDNKYVKNTKNGKKGEVKEKGYKIENICYKTM